VISYKRVELPVKHEGLVNNIIQARSPITFGLINMMVLKRQLDHKDKEFKNVDMRFSNPYIQRSLNFHCFLERNCNTLVLNML
jgi:hypothetical protein